MIGLSAKAESAAVAARLGSLPEALRGRLRTLMDQLSRDLQARVEQRLSGGALRMRSGRLAAGIAVEVEDTETQIAATVGVDGNRVPYAAALEFGATTRAHLIEAKNAKALAFTIGGRLRFAKRVQHPGSKIPERSFLRSALAAVAPQAQAELAAIADEESAQ